MTHNISSILNPPENDLEEGPATNLDRMLALHELELAKTVSLELIRDCPEEVRAAVKKAFDEAIKGLS